MNQEFKRWMKQLIGGDIEEALRRGDNDHAKLLQLAIKEYTDQCTWYDPKDQNVYCRNCIGYRPHCNYYNSLKTTA